MRIVFFAPFGLRPKGTLIARMLPLACALQERGHTVLVIAPPYTNPEDSGRTEIVEGVEIRNIELARGSRAASALPNAMRMLKAADCWKPDLVHLFKPKGYGGIASMLHLVRRRLGLQAPPVIVDSDDWEGMGGMNERLGYSELEQRVYAFQERWLLRHSAGVTVASRELARLAAPFRRNGQVLYLPNGALERPALSPRAAVREHYAISEDSPLLLLYTRFFEFGLPRIQHVLRDLLKSVAGLTVMVVGIGPGGEEKALAAWVESEGCASSFRFCGWIEAPRIAEHIAACDAALYPLDDTVVNRTKCPAKLVEIIAHGVPVVADRIGQAAEYLEDGSGGYLVDCGDTAAMIDRICRLLSAPVAARLVGAKGQLRIAELFTWRRRADELTEFYHSMTERLLSQ